MIKYKKYNFHQDSLKEYIIIINISLQTFDNIMINRIP